MLRSIVVRYVHWCNEYIAYIALFEPCHVCVIIVLGCL
jgi:hypothetical protein